MLTGLPGRPRTSVSPWVPHHVGPPGRSATRQKTSRTPCGLERRLDVVVRPHGQPAAEQQQVRAGQRAGDRRADRAAVVAHVLGVQQLAAVGREQRPERQQVRLVDLAGAERPARRDELVAGGEDHDARAARAAQRRAWPPLAATPISAGAEHACPGCSVTRRRPARRRRRGGRASPAASASWRTHRCPASRGLVRSTGSTPSAPAGNAAPVEIRTASPGTDGPRVRRAGPGLAGDPQRPPGRPGRRRVAVHRGVVERRDVVRRRDGLGQHAAGGGGERRRPPPAAAGRAPARPPAPRRRSARAPRRSGRRAWP